MILAKVISLVALASYLAIIFISMRQKGRRRVNLAFILYLGAMAFWQLAAVMVTFGNDSTSALLWYRVMTAGMGVQFIFLLSIYPGVRRCDGQKTHVCSWLGIIFRPFVILPFRPDH